MTHGNHHEDTNGSGNGRVHPAAAAKPGTAAALYAERHANVGAMLDWLDAELRDHATRAGADPGNWGFAGDLGEAEALVKRALAHLAGMDESAVDAALAARREG